MLWLPSFSLWMFTVALPLVKVSVYVLPSTVTVIVPVASEGKLTPHRVELASGRVKVPSVTWILTFKTLKLVELDAGLKLSSPANLTIALYFPAAKSLIFTLPLPVMLNSLLFTWTVILMELKEEVTWIIASSPTLTSLAETLRLTLPLTISLVLLLKAKSLLSVLVT